MLNFHGDVDRSHVDIEVKSLYDIFFQYHNDVAQCKLHVIEIPIFNVALISDKDINKINNGKHVLFHLLKCSDKLYGNIDYKMHIQTSKLIQVPASFVFAAISEFYFSGFSKLTIN